MTELNLKILELLKENKNLREISHILSISIKEVYISIKQLMDYGYRLEPSYSYNSDIYYNFPKKDMNADRNSLDIKISKTDNYFRCLVVSDLHIGSTDSDIRLMDMVYDYAVRNGIHYIFNCGDVIEGDYTTSGKMIHNIHDQLEYFIKKHPYADGINNVLIFGNHDFHSLYYDGLDISKVIKNERHDIIPLSYGQGNVNVKNDSIILFHKLYDGFKPVINNGDKILLSGHGHLMKTKIKDVFWLGIPTLSHKSNDKTKEIVPGFVDLGITLENDKFEYLEATHLIINPNVVAVSESRCRIKTLFTDNRWK